MEQAILVENLVKKYGTKEAVKGIPFGSKRCRKDHYH